MAIYHATRAAAVSALGLCLLGCGAAQPEALTPEDLVRRAPEPLRIVNARTGEEASFEEMVDDLATARVVYVGERHDDTDDHALQYAVLKALYDRDPSLAIGMEMFQRPYQEPLDDYVAERIDQDEMLARTDYADRWGYDFGFYRPILGFARSRGIPLIALNAPKEVTRTMAQGGLEALSEEQRASLPELDLEDARHRAMIMEALTHHPGMEQGTLDRFYLAQVTWDETMAESVAETLAAPGAPQRMLVLAGRMHVRAGLGIPKRAGRRGAEPYRVVLPVAANEDDASFAGALEETPADWIVVFQADPELERQPTHPPVSSDPHGDAPHGSHPHGENPHGSHPHGESPHGENPHGSHPHGDDPDEAVPQETDAEGAPGDETGD